MTMPLTVDVAGGERDDLGDTQAGGIDGDEGRPHLEIGDRLQEAHHLVSRQDGGQCVLLAGEGDLLGELLLAERRAVEEPQGTHDRVDRCRLEAARNEVQAIVAHVLDGQLVRRLLVEGAEVCHRTGVDVLRVRRHVADLHVVDHALPQRAHRLRHGSTPVNWNCTERAILADGAVKSEDRGAYGSMSQIGCCATCEEWLC